MHGVPECSNKCKQNTCQPKRDLQYRGFREERLDSFRPKKQANFLPWFFVLFIAAFAAVALHAPTIDKTHPDVSVIRVGCRIEPPQMTATLGFDLPRPR